MLFTVFAEFVKLELSLSFCFHIHLIAGGYVILAFADATD